MVLQEWFWAQKLGVMHDRGRKIGIFRFLAGSYGHAPLRVDWALSTRQNVGAYIGAGGECADAIEASVGADRLAQLTPLPHTRSLRTASRGNADLTATFLVVDACSMNSVNTNGCSELDVQCCRVLRLRLRMFWGAQSRRLYCKWQYISIAAFSSFKFLL